MREGRFQERPPECSWTPTDLKERRVCSYLIAGYYIYLTIFKQPRKLPGIDRLYIAEFHLCDGYTIKVVERDEEMKYWPSEITVREALGIR